MFGESEVGSRKREGGEEEVEEAHYRETDSFLFLNGSRHTWMDDNSLQWLPPEILYYVQPPSDGVFTLQGRFPNKARWLPSLPLNIQLH